MRTFFQAQDESLIINGDITVTILKVEGDEAILEIDAPEWLAIDEVAREESRDASLPAR